MRETRVCTPVELHTTSTSVTGERAGFAMLWKTEARVSKTRRSTGFQRIRGRLRVLHLPPRPAANVCVLFVQCTKSSHSLCLCFNPAERFEVWKTKNLQSIFENKRREQSQAVHQNTSFPEAPLMYNVHLQMVIKPPIFSYRPHDNLWHFTSTDPHTRQIRPAAFRSNKRKSHVLLLIAWLNMAARFLSGFSTKRLSLFCWGKAAAITDGKGRPLN